MQATLCDNCRKPGTNVQEMNGWRRLGRAILNDNGKLTIQSEHDLCSDECLLLFVKNDWKSAMPKIDEPIVNPKEQAHDT